MISFDNSYARLPEDLFERVRPTPVKEASLITLNTKFADSLGLNKQWLSSKQGIAMLSGNEIVEGSDPIAMAYAGHQFGNWVPQLGDGRAVLLGEIVHANQRFDLQLKGAGRTPFSRGGDGRNWVGPVLREYLVSEAMAALGVPTTRALAAVTTGDFVLREQGPLPGAILTRVARSHIRVGTFQFFAARGNKEALLALIDHVIERHYPHLIVAENRAASLLEAVINAQAELVAHWQSIGFIHGVMNTDNCSISGDTIDYGPCAFMDTYKSDMSFSSIDVGKRYAYQNQPRIAQWNLVNFAQCLLPFIHENQDTAIEIAQEAINQFDSVFVGHYVQRMRVKLGLSDEHDDDLELASLLLQNLETQELDFTISFTQLSTADPKSPFASGGALHDWHLRWQQRLDNNAAKIAAARDNMLQSNPRVIPRNHLIETVIEQAVADGDFSAFEAMLTAVTAPFAQHRKDSEYTKAPEAEQVVTATFCGT